MTFYAEEDRWHDAHERELEREAEHREASELARRDREIDKGDWPRRTFRRGVGVERTVEATTRSA